MTCTAYQQRLVAWRDGELSTAEAHLLARHVHECEAYATLDARLQAVTPRPFHALPPISEHDAHRLARALDNALEPPTPLPASRQSPGWSHHVAWAAAVLMLLGWGWSHRQSALALQAQIDQLQSAPPAAVPADAFRATSWQPDSDSEPSDP